MIERITAEWLTRPETQAVFAALRDAGFEARAVGGAVRNALIGKPAADVDLATTALPEQTVAAAECAGMQVIPTGLKHGTVTVVYKRAPIEVTTLRRDVETDGRHATVAFTDDWALDASRRDFTINALYCDAAGVVHDPLGGLPDLHARRVRFIGDAHARIREDYLRILRFFRFTAEYAEGPPDATALLACSELRSGLQQLSAERIRNEIFKLLVAPRAADIATVMFEHGYWPSLLGVVVVPGRLRRREDLDVAHRLLPNGEHRLAVFAVETTEDAARLADRLRLSGFDRDALDAAARLSEAFHPNLDATDVKRLLYREQPHRARAALAFAEARQPGDWRHVAALLASITAPVLPVRGQDLVDRGVAPGPALGIVLKQLEQAWIDSDFTLTRDQLLADVRVSKWPSRKASSTR